MALSYCPSWGAFQHLDTEMEAFQHAQADIATEVLCFCDNCGVPDTMINHFFEPEDSCYLENNTHLLPYLNAPETITSLPPDFYSMDEWECYQYPKPCKNLRRVLFPGFRLWLLWWVCCCYFPSTWVLAGTHWFSCGGSAANDGFLSTQQWELEEIKWGLPVSTEHGLQAKKEEAQWEDSRAWEAYSRRE